MIRKNSTQHLLSFADPSIIGISKNLKYHCRELFREQLLKSFFEDAMKWDVNRTAQQPWEAVHWGISNDT